MDRAETARAVEVAQAVRRLRAGTLSGGRDLRNAYPRNVVADLRAARFLEVTGLNSLIRDHYTLKEKGGGLLLVCPESQIRRLLEIAGISVRMAVHGDTAEAVRVARGETPNQDGG